MERESVIYGVDPLIAAMARRQHGVVAWFQLRAAGVSRGLVDFRLRTARLHIIHRGVYAVGHRVLSDAGRRMAAVLALGPGAVLSHRSAAEHWGLLPRWDGGAVHVTVPAGPVRRRRAGIIVHRTTALEATVRDGIPVTTVERTLLDLAASTRRRTLDRAIEGAEVAGLFDLRALAPVLATDRPGVRTLRAALAEFDDAPTRSELERRFLELCRDHGLPRPLVNTMVAGHQVDFVWHDVRVIVETDGGTHDARAARRRDSRRDLATAIAGYRTLRFSWQQVVHEPELIVAALRPLLHHP